MKSWPILLAVMLLALTTSTLGNFDANALDKDENQVKTQSLDEDRDEDHDEDIYGPKCKHRFMHDLQGRLKCGLLNKVKQLTKETITEDGNHLSDELKKKITDGIMETMADIVNNPDKLTKDIASDDITSILNSLSSLGPEKEKPVKSGNP